VYGVPETFVVDQDGVIRYKHIGPVTAEALQQTILPLVRELQGNRGPSRNVSGRGAANPA
jgi:cytochrome c biogenesis protein CcmG/thiol:disulfide interchange protein DsbE